MNEHSQSSFKPVAVRHLEVDGKPSFLIEIGLPYQEKGDVWFCPYQISGPETQHQGRFGGIDAVQAMLNVFYTLSAEAEGCVENLEGRLTWGGQREHFGFPNHSADPELIAARSERE